METKLPIIVITGPTASGKTKIAITAARAINAEIICADSRIVYKDFDIVSAKPTLDEREGVRHHLIDIIDANKTFSAGDFVSYANAAIHEIQSRGKRVIISGGTWFYIKALLDEKKMPQISADKKLREELKKCPADELHKMLYKLDPKRAAEVEKNNVEKVIRSIEMCRAINAPISEFKREENTKYEAKWFMPPVSREEVYNNINKRVNAMITLGLEDEFKRVVGKYGVDNEIIANTIGYAEFLKYKDKNEIIDKIKQHTRNFAKRQFTYFKNNKDIQIIEKNSFNIS